MIEKIAAGLEMAFEIPESDKKVARICINLFESIITLLDHTEELLDMMYDPFKSADTIDTKDLEEAKGAIFRYKGKIKEKYENAKYLVLKSIGQFIYFDSDAKAHEMNESFKDQFEDLESQVKDLLDLMDDIEETDFQHKFLKQVDDLKNQHQSLRELVEDRMVDYLKDNVLQTNWFDESKDRFSIDLNKKLPNLVQLYQQQDKDLRGNVRQLEIQPTPPQKAERDEVEAQNKGEV